MVYIIQYSLWYKILKKILYKSYFLDLERIKIIYINFYGKNCFAFRTIYFWNSLLERIIFDNRGLTVLKIKQLANRLLLLFLLVGCVKMNVFIILELDGVRKYVL